MAIHFGTDGWRAVISDEFTFDNVRKVAQAIAEKTLADCAGGDQRLCRVRPSLVVGFDTRFLSDRYAAAVAEVLAANGIHVWLTHGDSPTPVTSFAIVDKHADGGVMITASHNPPRYNGIKLKAAFGGSASPPRAKKWSGASWRPTARPRSGWTWRRLSPGPGDALRPLPRLRAHVRALVDFDAIPPPISSVAVDAMYGAGRSTCAAAA
jgi:phosphomannomutase